MSDVEVPEIPPTRLLVTDLPDYDPQKMIKAMERTAKERLRDFIYDQENNKACAVFCSKEALYRVLCDPPVVMDTMMKVDIYYPWPVNPALAYCVELCGIHTLTEHVIWKHFENARRSGGGQIDNVWIDYPRAYIKFVDKQAAWRVVYKFRHLINDVEVQTSYPEKLPSSLSNRYPVAPNGGTPVDPSEKPAQAHPSEQSTQVDPSETSALRTTHRPNPLAVLPKPTSRLNPSPVLAKPKRTPATPPPRVSSLAKPSDHPSPVLAKPKRTPPTPPPRVSSLAKPSDQTRLHAPALPRDPPSSPIGQLIATDITATELTLSWQPPANSGGSPLTGYLIEKREGVKLIWAKVAQAGPDSLKYRITDLTPGMAYLFRVSAENKDGTSNPLVMEEMVTPTSIFETPEQPVGPIEYSNITEDSVTLTWKAPSNDGGSPITGYNIEYHDVRLPTWQKAGSVGADRTTWTISTLIEDQEYVFRLIAVNAAGQSTPLETTNAAKPQRKLAAPSQPTEVQVKTIFYYSAILTWKPPQEDGGSKITAYRVLMKEDDQDWKELAKLKGFENIYEVKCLKHDKKYKFALVAENKAGTSELTETVTVTRLEKNPVALSAPVGPVEFINPQRDSVVVAWKPSEQDGGSPITGYCLEMREASKSSWRHVTKMDADMTSYCVQNLKQKTEYVFRILAESNVGRSDALVSESITLKTPIDKPGKPVGPIEYSNITEDSVTLTWKAPSNDGGSPITGYNIEYHDVRRPTWQKAGSVGADRTTLTVAKLVEDQEYVFRVTAANAAGNSTPLEATYAAKTQRKITAPSQPTKVTVQDIFKDSTVLTWKAPQTDGGSKITAYRVLIKEDDQEWKELAKVNGFENNYDVKGLKQDKKYKFAVVAENKAGPSEPTETATATVLKKKAVAPSAPVGPVECMDPQRDSVVVAWKTSKQDGGSPITCYCLEMREASISSWRQVTKVDADMTFYCVQNLKDKVEYFFRIVAENTVGRSDALVSESITLKTPSETSGTPQPMSPTEQGPERLTATSTSPVLRAVFPSIRVSRDWVYCDAWDSCWLPDGGLLIVDGHVDGFRSLKRLNSAFDIVAHLELPSQPLYVCYNAWRREASVSFTDNNLILFVSLKKTGLAISRELKAGYNCLGVVCRQDELWWMGRDINNNLRGVYIVDWTSGERRGEIVPRNDAGKMKVPGPCHLAVSDGRDVLYIAGSDGLYIIHRDGTVMGVVKGFTWSSGVCVGDANSVFLCGKEKSSKRYTVVQYDREGRRIRELVTHEQFKGEQPESISYNGKMLAVTLCFCDCIAVFHLK